MFVDLVGSARLADQLDPEDSQALLQAYRTAAGRVVDVIKADDEGAETLAVGQTPNVAGGSEAGSC